MDPLDRLAAPGANLLSRVDATLIRVGIPEAHRVLPLLRQLGVLPGTALAAVVALRPAGWASAGPRLLRLSEEYRAAASSLPAEAAWEGPAGRSFGARCASLAEHLGGPGPCLSERLAAQAAFAEAVDAWIAQLRARMTRELLAVLTSAEAVVVVTDPATAPGGSAGPGPGARDPRGAGTFDAFGAEGFDGPLPAGLAGPRSPSARAAAEIAARVLDPIVQASARVPALLKEFAPRLAELPYLVRVPAPTGPDPITRVHF